MANVVPFESAKLPAHLAALAASAVEKNSELVAGGGGGFPSISIKGKVFHIKRGDEVELVTKPGEDDPAASIEVVILKAGPAAGKASKVYYIKGYTEGSDASPDCYSNDGMVPEADSVAPQADKCAICPQNQWGSKITQDGKKGKSCADSKRLAIAQPGLVNDPMLLRVPAASLRALGEYASQLGKRGVNYDAVVTRIGFDYTVAHPQLTFKPVGFLDEDTFLEVQAQKETDVVNRITGFITTPRLPAPEGDAEPFESAPAKAAAKETAAAAPAKPAAKKPAAKPASMVAALDADEAPPKAAKPAAKVVEVADDAISEDLDAALAGLDFDA